MDSCPFFTGRDNCKLQRRNRRRHEAGCEETFSNCSELSLIFVELVALGNCEIVRRTTQTMRVSHIGTLHRFHIRDVLPPIYVLLVEYRLYEMWLCRYSKSYSLSRVYGFVSVCGVAVIRCYILHITNPISGSPAIAR